MWDKADADAREALEDLAKQVGAQEVDLPDDYRDAWSAQRAIMAVDMAHNLGGYIDKGGEVSPTFRALVEEGRKVTATQYLAALRDAGRYAEGMMSIFEQLADAILTLSAKGVAPLGIEATGDPVFCSLWSLVGFPSLNLPLLANSDGLPIGVQLVAAPGRDERLVRTAHALVEQLDEAE
jgi:Asp-tRNA(Asn)/Glu-tRNA(Gln) amidotransferase A subunit family amidase